MEKSKILDKSIIKDFANKIDNFEAKRVFYLMAEYIDEISNKLSQNNNIINEQNIELFEAGDLYFNSLTINSELDFFLSIKSPQIEMNSTNIMGNKFNILLNKIKHAWQNRRKKNNKFDKRKQKKLNKKNSMITEKDLLNQKEKQYSLYDLKNDFFNELTFKLTNMTILYNTPSNIKIFSKDEFKYKINIYPVIKRESYFKIWDNNKHKLMKVDILNAKQMLEEKAKLISKQNSINKNSSEDILFEIIRIFKNLYFNFYKTYDYQFIESLIYYCPNSLFTNNDDNDFVYNVFLKVLNYLNHYNLINQKALINSDNTISQQYNISNYKITNFINLIKNNL